MSRLNDLIKEYCPHGVEYKKLADILKIKNGADYKNYKKGEIPVYGSGGIISYIDTAVYDKPSVLIPRKGSVDKLYYVETPFWNVDTIFYTEIFPEFAVPKYVYYFLQKEHLERYNTAGGVPSLTQKTLNIITIPVPPLPVQEEIVQILDSFSAHIIELQEKIKTEIEIRNKQYNYYRDNLLSFSADVRWQRLGDTCFMRSGKAISSSDISPEKDDNILYPCYGGNGIRGYVREASHHGEYPIIGRQGALCGNVNYATGDFYATVTK